MSQRVQTPVNIRWWKRADMTQMLTIEGFNEKSFLEMVSDRDTIAMVAEKGDHIVGYVVYEIYRGGITLLDLTVHPDWRGQYIGTQLFLKLLQKLSPEGRTYIKAVVDERKLLSQQYLRRLGFLAVSVERGWFQGGFYDGFVFILRWNDIQKSFFVNYLTEISTFRDEIHQENTFIEESEDAMKQK